MGVLYPAAVITAAGFIVGTTVVSVDRAAGTAVLSNPSTSNGVQNNVVIVQGFTPNTSYDLAAMWMAGAGATGFINIYVNRVLVFSTAITSIDMAGANLTQIGIGSTSTGSSLGTGDVGHTYIKLSDLIDLSLPTNMDKFAKNGLPVDLGNSSIPTSNPPAYYYDGAAPAWSNQGSAGNVTFTGALTAGIVPSFVP